MSRSDDIRLRHMLDAAREAVSFADGRERGDLESDRQFALALVKAIEIVGEAAGSVGESTRLELADIPWPAIVAMRNRLVHAYFTIDLDIVWQTVRQDLPILIAQLESIGRITGDMADDQPER